MLCSRLSFPAAVETTKTWPSYKPPENLFTNASKRSLDFISYFSLTVVSVSMLCAAVFCFLNLLLCLLFFLPCSCALARLYLLSSLVLGLNRNVLQEFLAVDKNFVAICRNAEQDYWSKKNIVTVKITILTVKIKQIKG